MPGKISWRKAPDTWWRLLVEVSRLAFTLPQWDFTPAVGETMRLDKQCSKGD
jgi:hypothetical protein